MAYITGVLVKKKDLPSESNKAELLEIREDYCIGCGLYVKLFPEYYEMKEAKAVVKKTPEGEEDLRAVRESVEKCQSKDNVSLKHVTSGYMSSGNWVIDNLNNTLKIWNDKLSEIWQLVSQSPMQFKGGGIWNVIVNIHGALQAIGLGLRVLFLSSG